jgi:P pilus assembly chaperone PapD
MYRLLSLAALVLVLASGALHAQISISPKRILLNARERSQEITIANSGQRPFEITADVTDFFIRTDSLGNEQYDTVANADEAARSCRNWVKIYPKRLIVPPNSTRTIRLLASPPAELGDGEYNARLQVSSIETGFAPVDAIDTTKITIDMKMRLKMVLQVAFRKGEVSTGLDLLGVQMSRSDSGTALLVDVRSKGNGAYRGMLSGILKAKDGRVVDSVTTPYIVDITGFRQRIPLNQRNLPDGTYDLIVESKAVLPGTAGEFVLPAPPVRRTYTVTTGASGFNLAPRDF